MSSSLFCFGLGYCATHLATELLAAGWRVAGTHRPDGRKTDDPAIRSFAFARGQRPPAGALDGAAHLLSSIPPDEAGDPVVDEHGEALAALPGLRWIGYLSTTGVYGNRDGGWVDENDAVNPSGPRNRRRVAAENAWLALWRRRGVPVHIFRLAGIYGPGRSTLDAVRAGTARRIVKPGQVFSRTHVEDVAAVLRASMAKPNPGAVYNVCDDNPAPPDEVVAHACALLGAAPPPLEPFDAARATMSEAALSFYADSKRVANARIKDELGVRLRYPDYRAGLSAILAAEGRTAR